MKTKTIHTKASLLRNILVATLSPLCLWMASSGIAQAVTYTQPIDWTMAYNGNVLPNNTTANSYSNGNTGGWTYNNASAPTNLGLSIVDEQYLGFNTTASGWAILNTNQVDQLFLNTDIGYTVEYRVRVLSAFNTGTNNNPAGGALDMNDGRSNVNAHWLIGFGEDVFNPGQNYMRIRGVTDTPLVYIGTEWITYTILVENNAVTYYMDGVLVGSIGLNTTNSSTISRWGHLTATTFGVEMEVDYLKIYDQGAIAPIPEPHTYALIGGLFVLGIAGLTRLRSKHRQA